MIVVEFLCVIIFTVSLLLYINNVIVDIGSAINVARSFGNDDSDTEKAKLFAKFRITLAVIMGVTLALIICF